MRLVHSSNTTPEILFRKALWAKGFRYAVCKGDLPGKPDIVIPSKRLAVFVDGDFWHGRQWRQRRLASLEEQFKKTKTKKYWVAKIRRNMVRDCSATASLLSKGWTVLRFWESQLSRDMETCVNMTLQTAQGVVAGSATTAIPYKSVAEFFAGIGLMRLGLDLEGWSTKFANDIDPLKYAMYRDNFPDTDSHFSLEDIHKLVDRPDVVPTVALATASFPCNDLSVAGAMKGLNGKQSSAFWGFVNVLKAMGNRKPPMILLENVVGFLMAHHGDDFRQALVALNQLGYSVDAFIINAVHFVPQSRPRLFVVGSIIPTDRQSGRDWTSTDPTELRPEALLTFINRHPEIRWNIRPLPTLPRSKVRLPDILEDLADDDPHWWSPERAKYLLDQMSPRHKKVAMHMMQGERWSYGTVFRRMRHGKSMGELRVDGLAGCLRTPRGGSGRQILFRAGKGKYAVRLLIPREASRLMGADDYKLSVPLNQALFGFGDAVCVPVIQWIARHYLNPLVSELLRGSPLTLTTTQSH
jgi:DNA (cytosine-5)-methyltransferase 1